MIFLPQSLSTFGSDHFEQTFKQELVAQDEFARYLQQAMQFGSAAQLDDIEIMLNRVVSLDGDIELNIGVFYHSIIAGCNCADDPSPVEKNNEYAEIQIRIDGDNGATILKPC